MSKQTFIGIDLGGTKSIVARFDAELRREDMIQFPTLAERGLIAVLDDIVDRVRSMRGDSTAAVGIGVPGLVRHPEGTLMVAPNIPDSRDMAVRQILQQKLRLPVAVENDARCFTLAEATLGAAARQEVVIGITLGTGVGGGIVINGKIFHGAHGFAGEIGHMLLIPGKPPYETKDVRGVVEQFLSGTALGRRCQSAKEPQEYLEGEVCAFLRPDIFREIAWLCASLTHLLDPSIIVFGGSAGLALKPHFSAIEEELKHWLVPGTPLPTLALSTVEHAGAVGAAILGRQLMEV